MKSKIRELINNSNSIVLLTHENPDGDAIGSTMAFYYFLSSINKSVDVVIPVIPKLFSYFSDIDKVITDSFKEYDLGIVLDCANVERIGQVNDTFHKCKKIIAIDHHISNTNYGNLSYVDACAPACSQVVYYLFKDWKISIDKFIGIALTTGMLTDTCGFRNDNVNKDTYLMAADMYKIGINIYELYDKVITRKSVANFKLSKIVFNRLEFYYDNKVAFSYITLEDFNKCEASLGDHEGLVDLGRNIYGVEVSIFIREQPNGIYSISFRSNGKILVNELAKVFGGGGHDMAAGAKVNMEFDKIKEMVLTETKKFLDK